MFYRIALLWGLCLYCGTSVVGFAPAGVKFLSRASAQMRSLTPLSSHRSSAQSRSAMVMSGLSQEKVDKSWDEYFTKSLTGLRYQIIASPAMEKLANQIVEEHPTRFKLHETGECCILQRLAGLLFFCMIGIYVIGL